MLPPIANLVAHWKMNDNNDDSVVSDSTGLHNGVWQHGTTASDSVQGKINKALNFVTPDISNIDYVVIPDNSKFNNSTFSFCAWLNCTTPSLSWNRILSKKDQYYDSDGYEITLDGINSNTLWVSGSSSAFATTPTVNWWEGGWHHLVVIFSATTVTVYCDGDLKTTTGSISSVITNGLTLRLGKVIAESTTTWKGYMDDVRYYDIALTQDQVASIYNNGDGTESDIIAFNPFVSFKPGVPSD